MYASCVMIRRTQTLGEKLDPISFDRLLEDQDPFGSPAHRFDLTGVTLITSAGLVQLAGACYALRQEGYFPVVAVDDPAVRSYMARAGFVTVMQSVAQFDPPFSAIAPRFSELQRGSNLLLIEVTRIDSGAALPDLLDRIVSVLRQRFRYRKNDAYDAATAVSRYAENTFDHNSDICGFIAMQSLWSRCKAIP